METAEAMSRWSIKTWWRNLNIRSKLLTAGITLTILPTLFIAVITSLENGRLMDIFNLYSQTLAKNNMDTMVNSVYEYCNIENQAMVQHVRYTLEVARESLNRHGRPFLSAETVSWNAINQFNNQLRPVELPKFYVGNEWLGQINDPGRMIPVIDEVRHGTNITVTIFQRMDQEGDMLRVCTNVIDAAGRRAIGTYIPVRNPDGETNAVVGTVLKGEAYVGRAFVVDSWYITAYEPIYDGKRAIIGMLYVGVKQETSSIYSRISSIKIGKTGYVYVLNTQGKDRGKYVISKDNLRNGEVILNSQDSNGSYFIQKIIQKAVGLRENEIAEEKYPWTNTGEVQPRIKTARYKYFQPWDWVIAVSAYEDEMREIVDIMKVSNQKSQINLLLIGLVGVGITIGVWIAIARSYYIPIKKAVGLADAIRQGDIGQRLNMNSLDEIGQLAKYLDEMADSIQTKIGLAEKIAEGDLTHVATLSSERDIFGKTLEKMSHSLNDLLTRLKTAAEQVLLGANEISNTSQSLSQGSAEQASSLEEITSSMTEIGAKTKTNAENASQVDQLSKASRQAAENGSQKMNEMMTAMGAIQSSSKEIVKIIKVIDDIAFQTNLLALNAAVEAARAGRHGKGFAVVAEEVRNLAARSAKAAKETAELIDDSMKKVDNGILVATHTVQALKLIEEGIVKTTDLIGSIAASSNEQARGVFQINQGLGQIDMVTQRTTAGAEELASAAEQLRNEAAELNQAANRFKLRSDVEAEARALQADENREADREPMTQKVRRYKPRPEGDRKPDANRAMDGDGGGSGKKKPAKSAKTKAESKGAEPSPETIIAEAAPDASTALDDGEFGRY